MIDGGVDYIVSLGTTGESVVLNDQEKTSVVEHTINTVEKRVPICLGIGGNDTMAIVDKIKKQTFRIFQQYCLCLLTIINRLKKDFFTL